MTRPGTRPAVPGTRPVTRRRRRLVTNETAATDGVMYAKEGPYTIDVRHLCLAATGGVMYTNEEELKFDEDEMAGLEGQRLVAQFRCRIY